MPHISQDKISDLAHLILTIRGKIHHKKYKTADIMLNNLWSELCDLTSDERSFGPNITFKGKPNENQSRILQVHKEAC